LERLNKHLFKKIKRLKTQSAKMVQFAGKSKSSRAFLFRYRNQSSGFVELAD